MVAVKASAVRDISARGQRTKLADVAEQAGVSKSIASRVLNDSPGLSTRDDTRQRVIEAARQLNYRPHAAARGLKRAETGLLSLVIPTLTNPIFALISRGCVERAMERDIAVLLTEDSEAAETDKIIGRLVQAGRIDGVIVASASPAHPLLKSLKRLSIPHVFVLRSMPGSRRNVSLPDEAASALAVDHLLDLGHLVVGHIAGPLAFSSAQRLARGFRVRATTRGAREALLEQGEFSEEAGAEATYRLLTGKVRPTGLTTASVSQAVGALHAAWQLGLSVPDELSIVTCGDAPIMAFLCPPVTAVRLPYSQVGAAAVDALIEQLLGGNAQDHVVQIEPEVVVRQSTAPPFA